MSSSHHVSSHLQIALSEYDTRIRTFVPYYEEMLEVVSECVATMARPYATLLDLGIGTGALSHQCRALRPDLSLIGIDADSEILSAAGDRLGADRVDLRAGSFTDIPLPDCDVIVSSLALHHVSTAEDKCTLYRRCRAALRDGGVMVIADCFLPGTPALVPTAASKWKDFLMTSYSSDEAAQLLDAWSGEDTYFPLTDELLWLTNAGFQTDVGWRRDMFGVIVCE